MEHENRTIHPNHANVLAKVVDGEAILINVGTGTYYSLTGIGGRVWQWIEADKSIDEMVLALTRNYDVTPEDALKDISALVADLTTEGLVTTSAGKDTVKPPAAATESPPKTPYETPQLDIYRDMQDLLALDPPMPGLRTIPWADPEKIS
jgi:hypothetical protein